MFKLDRTTGKGHSHKTAPKESDYWKTKTVDERLEAAFYLNSIAYNFDIDNPPRMDKTVFISRKHKDI
jgi:hypothetical protein